MSEELRQNLLDAGCDGSQIEAFEQLAAEGREGDKVDLLETHRKVLLDRLHQNQRQIDCLDYLLYQLRKGGHRP